MKLEDALKEGMTVPGNVYQDMKAQNPFWGAGRGKPRDLGDEEKDPRYNWKTWKKWRKKLKKARKQDARRTRS
jgi:hypothetical protein